MVEDKQYLGVIDAIGMELHAILVDYNQRANGITDKSALIALRLEQFNALEESVKKNRRVLKFLNGEQVEPVAHSGEAVLVGVFGGGM
jgi:hypothetical protein